MTYHTDTSRISKSGLDLINRAPALYYERYLNPNAEPQKETAALIIGSAVHCAVLEPSEFGKRYAIAPKVDKRTKDGKAAYEAFVADAGERIVIDADTATLAERIMTSVLRYKPAAYLLKEGIAEQPIFWTDTQTEVECKAKPDWITDGGIIVDLKTTEDASPVGFARSVKKYRYDVQAAFYSDGYEQSTGKTCNGFMFIAVEKAPPYLVAVYFVGSEDLNNARQRYRENLLAYKQCKQTGIWNGYSEIVTKVNL
jgi:hypothetical protein